MYELDKGRQKDADFKNSKQSPSAAVDTFKTLSKQKREPRGRLLFEMPLITWGGKYKNTTLSDTCSFDCVLQMLFYLHNYTSFGKDFINLRLNGNAERCIKTKHFEAIMKSICDEDFSRAKYTWTKKVLGLELDWDQPNISFWEEEREHGLMPIADWFPIIESVKCSTPDCKRKFKSKVRNSIFFHPTSQDGFEQILHDGKRDHCSGCSKKGALHSYKLDSAIKYPVLVYHQIAWNREFTGKRLQFPNQTHDTLKKEMNILGTAYEVFHLCFILTMFSCLKLIIALT